jgi:hypothetical protein
MGSSKVALYAVSGVAAVLAVAVVAQALPKRPKLGYTPSLPFETGTKDEGPTLTPLHPLESHAEPEKATIQDLGICDFPGSHFVPCWCWSGGVNLAGLGQYADCDTAEDYARSVQEFGPPRGGAIVGFRGQTLSITFGE